MELVYYLKKKLRIALNTLYSLTQYMLHPPRGAACGGVLRRYCVTIQLYSSTVPKKKRPAKKIVYDMMDEGWLELQVSFIRNMHFKKREEGEGCLPSI